MTPITLAGIWLCALAAAPPAATLERFEFTQVEMGVAFKVILYAADRPTANAAAKSAYQRIHQLNGVCSDYDPQSELSRLSATAGDGRDVPVSNDLWRVLQASKILSRRTDGAFDVTVGPFVRLWRRARRNGKMPSRERLEEARRAVGFQFLQLDEKRRTARLLRPGMRLDLGGVAKGYAADAALNALRDLGVTRALVDGSGDISLGQAPPGKPGWKVGLAPLDAKGPPSRFATLENMAIATSGDAWQHVEIDGRRYSHIVDPHTGLGLTDRSSVTVIAPDGTLADSLASAVSVLGPKQGLSLIDNTPGAAAFVVRGVNGRVETFSSRRWKDFVKQPNE